MQIGPPADIEPVPDADLPASDHGLVTRSIDLRTASIALIALLASAYALQWASPVFIPLLLGVMASYTLSPVVDRLQRWRIPRALGAAVLLIAVMGGLGTLVYSLADDAAALVESMPDAAQKVRLALRTARGAPTGAIDKVQKAATNLEQAAEESAAAAPPTGKGVTRVQIERPRFNIRDYLWSGTLGLVGFIGQLLVVCGITFFLMASGDGFRRKLMKIVGPHFSHKRITIRMLDEITQQIQRYLMVQIFTSLVVGVAIWAVLLWIGMERAVVWGVAAAVLNLVPYIGSIVITGGSALVGFLQFGTPSMALLIAAASVAIHTLSGSLLTPWLTSRAGRMNPVVIFVGVLAWGWLWGVWGLLLGAPLLMAFKAVCDHVDALKPVGELLSA